ncbi:MAG: heme-degrading domain-containing protein [Nakamurella sp.]
MLDENDLIRRLADDETRLVFRRFDNDDAWALGTRLVGLARERQHPVTVLIERNGHRLFHAVLPGATPDNDGWARRKINVVRRFEESSYLVGRRLDAGGRTLDADWGVDPAEYAAHGGGFPIRIVDVGVVGVVAVSGLPQAADHALLVEAITAHLGV